MAHGNDNTNTAPPLSKKFGAIIGNQKVTDVLTEPAVEAVRQAEPVPAVQEKEPVQKPAKKEKRGDKGLRAKDKGDRTERMSFEVSKAERKAIMSAKVEVDKAVTAFAREAVLGYVYNGYVCAACGKRFIILNEEGEKDKPQACPCCQNTKFSRIVRM